MVIPADINIATEIAPCGKLRVSLTLCPERTIKTHNIANAIVNTAYGPWNDISV
jgi:hypothetical protein